MLSARRLDEEPGGIDGEAAADDADDRLHAELVEDVVVVAAEFRDLVDLAPGLAGREEVEGDVEEDTGGEPEDDAAERGGDVEAEEADGEGGDADAGGWEEEHRERAVGAGEAARGGVAGGALVGDDGEPEEGSEVGEGGVDGADDDAVTDAVRGELGGRTVQREVAVAEAVADGVRAEPDDDASGDAEPAEGVVVLDGFGDEEDGAARDHRTARESIAPDEAPGVAVAGLHPDDAEGHHRDERDPPDACDLPQPTGQDGVTREDGEYGDAREPETDGTDALALPSTVLLHGLLTRTGLLIRCRSGSNVDSDFGGRRNAEVRGRCQTESMHVIEMDWRHVLVASWPVAPETLAERLPPGLEPDTFEGDAYLSVVPFVMGAVRPRFVPRFVGSTFAELNLRTYVVPSDGGKPGIYFYNLDASDPVGVALARRLFGLPYYRASAEVRHWDDREFAFRSERTHEGEPPLSFEATYRATGPASTADPDSLPEFLMERYRFYVETGGGDSTTEPGLKYGDIEHDPWELAPADVEFAANDLFRTNGFDTPDGQPHVLFSDGVAVRASPPRTYE